MKLSLRSYKVLRAIRHTLGIAGLLTLLLSLITCIIWLRSLQFVGDPKFEFHAARPEMGWTSALLLAATMILLLCASEFPNPAKPAGYCPKCDYNLRGNTSGVCPECGSKLASR